MRKYTNEQYLRVSQRILKTLVSDPFLAYGCTREFSQLIKSYQKGVPKLRRTALCVSQSLFLRQVLGLLQKWLHFR